jgi:hypothetical protein
MTSANTAEARREVVGERAFHIPVGSSFVSSRINGAKR